MAGLRLLRREGVQRLPRRRQICVDPPFHLREHVPPQEFPHRRHVLLRRPRTSAIRTQERCAVLPRDSLEREDVEAACRSPVRVSFPTTTRPPGGGGPPRRGALAPAGVRAAPRARP